MRPVIGIVCEYNPFHAGHAYQIRESRRLVNGSSPLVICVMSGNFVQRGEWAILPRHQRAEAAVKGGADLVVELPLPWSLSSAEKFASGGVGILLGLGVTHISFGSETGDLGRLVSVAGILSDPAFNDSVTAYLRSHRELPYPEARAAVLREAGGDAEILSRPNDLLAAEYLKALNAAGGKNFRGEEVLAVAVKRLGSGHDVLSSSAPGSSADCPAALCASVEYPSAVCASSECPSAVCASSECPSAVCPSPECASAVCPSADCAPDVCASVEYPSAMELRRQMRATGEGVDSDVLELAAVSRLRMLASAPLFFLNDRGNPFSVEDAENGAWERLLLGIASGADTLDGICAAAKTRSLSYSRLRRIAMRAVLGVDRELTADGVLPPYAAVLAANPRGLSWLAELRSSEGHLPVLTQPKQLAGMTEFSRRVFAAGASAGDFYRLGMREHKGEKCGDDYRIGPVLLQNCEN